MQIKTKKFSISVIVGLILFLLPQLVAAQVPSGRPADDYSDPVKAGTGELCPTDKFESINGVCVPKQEGRPGSIRAASTVFQLIQIVLTWLLTFAGIIATVYLIIGGYQYITAAGNEELSEKGKKTLINSVIGIVVVVLAITIVTIITNTLGQTNPLG